MLIELSLLWLRVLVNINDLPLLSEVVSSVCYLDVSVLSISVFFLILNFDNLSFFVDKISSLVSEDLPPS
jgi:hypothetical protein